MQATNTLFEQPQVLPQSKKIITLAQKYLVTTLGGELIIINRNRAHQRILYERFMRNLSRNHSSSQQLMFPYELAFGAEELAIIESLRGLFEQIGFTFDIEADRICISGVPMHLTESETGAY